MNDVVSILKNYVQAIETTKSSQIIVANVRSFVQFLKSSSLQPIIATLKEQKENDLKGFKEEFTIFQADKKKAFCSIEEFVKSTPFLQKHLSAELFVQNAPDHFIFFEPFVKLDIRRFNEDLQRLIEVLVDYGYLDFANKFVETVLFTPLITSIFDEKGREKQVNPLRVLCHEYALGPFVFSEALDKCCREAENIRSKMNTALWNDLEELFLIYDWTNGGLPSMGPVRNNLLSCMKEGHTVERVNRIYGYILENQHLVSQEFDPRSILELQLFFDEKNRNIWIIGKKAKGIIEPVFLSHVKSEGGRFELMRKLTNVSPGTAIEHEDFEKCRNRIGFTKKNGLLEAFFEKDESGKGCNVYKGSTVRLSTEDSSVCLKTIFTSLIELKEKQNQLEEEQGITFPYKPYYSKHF